MAIRGLVSVQRIICLSGRTRRMNAVYSSSSLSFNFSHMTAVRGGREYAANLAAVLMLCIIMLSEHGKVS